MAAPEVRLTFESIDALAREIEENLAHGRCFVPNQTDWPLFADVDLLLVHPDTNVELRLYAQVVMVMQQGAMIGTALQFLVNRTMLDEFVKSAPDAEPEGELNAEDQDDFADDAAFDDAPFDEDEGGEDKGSPEHNLARERHLRFRKLPPGERQKIARGPSMDDRVLLERIYGVNVWDTLLRNPKITVPEVARIARKGTIPRPLLELIVENEQWIRQTIVRRALLSNPRLSAESATRVLRTLPSRELKLVPQQTAYPAIVRQAAQRLLKI